jgi:hypothetical protein
MFQTPVEISRESFRGDEEIEGWMHTPNDLGGKRNLNTKKKVKMVEVEEESVTVF